MSTGEHTTGTRIAWEKVVLHDEDPRRAVLEAQGWTVVARSFGAQFDADRIDRDHLRALVSGVDADVRPLGPDDVDAVLRLDHATADDYPGDVATRHTPLAHGTVTFSATRQGFGAVTSTGALVAMTVVDVEPDGTSAETDFTVVDPAARGRGLGVAVKAASVLALAAAGVTRFRTGGSAENPAILRANAIVGYVRDEEWLTLQRPAG